MPVAGAVSDLDQLITRDASFARGRASITAYVAHPKTESPRPGIVVIHEAFGLDDHTRDVARRFANVGFTVIAPELYSRIGPPPLDDREQLFAKMFSLRDDDVVADLEAAAAWLRARPDASGRVGIVGFCAGGRNALLAACSSTAFDATIDCWGGFITRATVDDETTDARPTPVIDLVDRLHGRLYAAVGAEDLNPSPDHGTELEQRLRRAGKDGEVEIYDNAAHAFFNETRPQMYNEDAAHKLWDRMVTFFRTSLNRT